MYSVLNKNFIKDNSLILSVYNQNANIKELYAQFVNHKNIKHIEFYH